MNFKLVPVCENDISTYIKDMQEAFQRELEKNLMLLNEEMVSHKRMSKITCSKKVHCI